MATTSTIKALAGLNAVIGLWLVAAPFVLGLGTAATWSAVITGLVIAGLGSYNYKRASDGEPASGAASWTNVLAGVWVLSAPFALGAASSAIANDLVVGSLVVVFAGYNAIKGTTVEDHATDDRGSGSTS